jgi:hypothetical protein
MPIFENEIPNGAPLTESSMPLAPLGSPELRTVDTSMGGFENFGQSPAKTGLGLDELSKIQVGNTATFDSPFELVTKKELLDNKRYALYERGKDLENIYGLQQGAMAQLGNATIKMGIIAGGTFAQSFATLPQTFTAIKNGQLSDAVGDPDGYEGTIDNYVKNAEDRFPNFMTRYEKESPFLAAIPGFAGSANFWGNSVLKNLGFTVGAIGGALVQNAAIGALTAGIGELPLLAAQVGKAALFLNKIFIGSNDVVKTLEVATSLGKAGKAILDVNKLAQISAGLKVGNGFKYGLAIYSSARTEAGVEGRDGYRQVKEDLLNQYKLDNLGAEPTPFDLKEIDDYAGDAMNTRFAVNMALLTVSNAIQFGSLFKSFGTASTKGLSSGISTKLEDIGRVGLKEGSLDEFEKKAIKGLGANAWNFVKPKLPLILSEGVYEEGGQYAAERGTYDYYTRKYKNPARKENVENWDSLNETMTSTGKGLMDQFGTTEGLQNMFIGAISAIVTGGLMGRIDQVKGKGKEARIQQAIASLNQFGLTGTLNEKYENTLNSIGIAKEMQEAADAGDIFKYKNLKDDMFFNYVMSRIPSGLHDVTIEQLNMLKDLKQEDFEKTFGMDFNESSKNTVIDYVDALVDKANNIKKTTDSLDSTFRNPFNNLKEPQEFNTFNSWKKDLAYYATVAPNVNSRMSSINDELFKVNPLLTTGLVSKVTNKADLVDLGKSYDEKADLLSAGINEFATAEYKRTTKEQVKALRTASERISLALANGHDNKSLAKILNFELNNQTNEDTNSLPLGSEAQIATYSNDINKLNSLKKHASDIFDKLSDKDAFEKYFEQARNMAAQKLPTPAAATEEPAVIAPTHVFNNKEGVSESAEIGREYELPASTSKIRKAGKEFKLIAPDGTTSTYDTKEKAEAAKTELDKDLSDLAKVKVLALNADGTLKVEDLSGNIQNISPDKLQGYGKIQSDQEKLAKNKETLDKEQAELDLESGEVNTGNPLEEDQGRETKKKAARLFFISGMTESEDWADVDQSAPHVTRSRQFLNNVKTFDNRNQLGAILVTAANEAQFGLEGLRKMSYPSMTDADSVDINNGFVAQVFVMQENGKTFFVDKDGKVIGEVKKTEAGKTNVELLSKMIFQTMPTTKLVTSKESSRARKGEEEEFETQAKAWAAERAILFADTTGQIKFYEFNVSRGIANTSPTNAKAHVGGSLISEDLISSQQGLIQISVDGTITHQGESIAFSKGRPVLQYGDTLEFLSNTKLGATQAKTLFQVIKALAKDIQKQSDLDQPVKLNVGLTKYLQNVLYLYKSAKTSKNQIFIDTDTMSISLGGTLYAISEIAENEEAIVDYLLNNVYHNINKDSLNETNFSAPFYEYELGPDGLLLEDQKEWENYQTYLLSSKDADGKTARSIENTPLVSTILKPTDLVPYTHKQKYATLIGYDLPVVPVEKKEAPIPPVAPGKKAEKAAITKIGEYTIGNDTPNIFEFKDQPIVFTATVNPVNNAVEVVVVVNKTIVDLAKDASFVKDVVIPYLNKVDEYEIDILDYNNLVKDWAEFNLAGKLMNMRVAAAAAAAAAEVIIPTVEVEEYRGYTITKTPENTYQIVNSDTGAEVYTKYFSLERAKEIVDDILEAPSEDIGASEDENRRVGSKEAGKERMTPAEIIIFKAWALENVPNIPYEVLDNIIDTYDNEKAWGVFENGVAKFYKGAIRGTEYHEVFEGVWKAFLSPQQKQDILDEFQSKKGSFTDRQSGKQVLYMDATDHQAKERLADDFADYRLGKLPARSIGEKILRFFKNIVEFFKTFGRNPVLKTELFKAINTGKFKEYVIPTSIKTEAPEYSRYPGMSDTLAYEYIDDMYIRTVQNIFGSKKALYDIKKLTSEDLYNQLKEAYESPSQRKYQALGDERFRLLFAGVKERLRTIGINFNEEDKVDLNEGSTDNKAYAPEPFSTDWKATSPYAVKISMILPQTDGISTLNPSELPKRTTSKLAKGFISTNFSRMFVTLMDKLSNTTKTNKFITKLYNIAKYDTDYVRLFKRVGGDISTGVIDFTNFKDVVWRLFINVFQTFSKQKPNAIIEYISGDDVFSASADTYTISKEVQRGWIEQMKALSTNPKSIIFQNRSEKAYQVKALEITPVKLKDDQWQVTDRDNSTTYYTTLAAAKTAATKMSFPVRAAADMVEFLGAIGINFSLQNYAKLDKDQKDVFAKQVSGIRTYLVQNASISSLKGRTLGINEQLNTLANMYVKITNPNQENTFYNVEGNKTGAYADNNHASIFENEFNSADTVEDLMIARPELNDIFSKNSVILKEGGLFIDKMGKRLKEFKVSYIGGRKNLDKNKGVSVSKLTAGDRITQEINQNINGNYYILIPGDSSTEWMLNMGNSITFDDAQTGRAWNKIFKTFRGYLTDDVSLALDYKNRDYLKNVGDRAKDLRFFRDILSKVDKDGNLIATDILKKINEMITLNKTQVEIEKYIDDNIRDIDVAIKEYIDESIAETKQSLITTNQLILNEDGTYSYKGLNTKFVNEKRVNTLNKYKLSEEDINDIITFTNANYTISNIEYHKIMFGDPYQFAIRYDGKLEETKRIKSFLSPRRITYDTPEYNTHLNQNKNLAGTILLKAGDLGYHNFKSFATTVSLSDIYLSSASFAKINETDAASVVMDQTYREIKLKNGQWPAEAEAWHQWQMAYARQNVPGYQYSSDALSVYDARLISTPEPFFVTEVMKPIVSGVKAGEKKFDLVLDKLSQMPLYYKAVQGKNLEKLYLKMWKEDIDYVVFASGRKVGIEKTHSLYNVDGTFNEAPFAEDTKVKVPWKAYGIQVENAYAHEKEQTRGSQITKMVTVNMFDNGVPVGATPERQQAIQDEYNRNLKILEDIHTHAYNVLLKKFGIEEDGLEFNLTDPQAVAETLQYELMRRQMSNNAIDSIKLDENKQFAIPLEASPVYKQIESILYSIINKSLVSLKTNGGPKVQVPVTLWENAKEGRGLVRKTATGYEKITKAQYDALSPADKKSVGLSSDTLKFYEDKDGKRICQVMIPHWFRDSFDPKKFPTDKSIFDYLNSTEEGKSILSGVGFRIPTQSMSSIESFEVAGFLPKSMGDTIVVPSEITAKAGSDFDIDKLNTYLKSVYVNENGDVKLISYKGSEEATKEFYRGVYVNTIQKALEAADKYGDFRVKLLDLFSVVEALEGNIDRDTIVNALNDEQYDFFVKYQPIIQNIINEAANQEINPSDYLKYQVDKKKEKLTSKLLNEKLKEDYIDNMYKKSLENEYYDSLQKLLAMPENFQHLMSPVNDAGLGKMAEKLDELRGENENSTKNRILNRNFMSSLRNAFVTAKKWVGIAAVNITGQSQTQKIKMHINTESFEKLSKADQRILGDGSIVLPHNTVMIDGREHTSISGTKTKDGKDYISNRLSGYGTAFVDVANDPYITKIISSDIAVGTFMFLERIGCGEATIMFMNQPIIKEYLSSLDNKNYKFLYKKANLEAIEDKFPTTEDARLDATIDVDKFADNISEYYKKGFVKNDAYNATQQMILTEFLKYAKMAEFSFKMTQASNYDTAKFKNGDSYTRKKTKTEIARETNIFTSVDELLDSGHIGSQRELVEKAMEGIGAIVKLQSEDYTSITNEVMKPYREKEFLSEDEYDKIASKVKASFLDYIIQTSSRFIYNIKELLNSDNSVINQLAEAKKKYPDMKILKDLVEETSDRFDGAKTIKLNVNHKDAYDENLYTEFMRELKEVDEPLFNNIVKMAILQGSYQSSVSIRNIIPLEDYAAIIKPIIDSLSPTLEVQEFANGKFQRGNWADETVMPEYSPKFFPNVPRGQAHLPSIMNGQDVWQYIAPAFLHVESKVLEFGRGIDRKMLLIDPIYSPLAIKDDFVKVKRLQLLDDGRYLDVATGISVPGAEFARRKAAGDTSLFDVYGYQKVKYANGQPVLSKNGSHVYKLINLWGDGRLLSEYYLDNRRSAINNGTIGVDVEIPDKSIRDFFNYGVETLALGEQENPPSPEIVLLETAVAKEVEEAPVEPTKKASGIKRTNAPLENQITDFEPNVQALFNDVTPSLNDYQTAVGNYQFDLSMELGEEERAKYESLLRDVQNSFEVFTSEEEEGIAGDAVFKYFGADYFIYTLDGIGIDVEGYKGKNINKQKLLNAFNNRQNAPFKRSTVEGEAKPTILESRNTSLDYTKGQEKALTEIGALIDRNKQGYYLLAGYAGTGKTTVAENIAKYAKQSGKKIKIVAPTNKAAKVLNEKLKQTGLESSAETIHSAIYGEPDASSGEWVLKGGMKDSVIIIDESSMVSKEIMKDLLKSTANNNILVFMGDGFQLEQIGEDSGLFKAITDPNIIKKLYGITLDGVTELTEVKRQSLDSNVLKVATLARTDNRAYVPNASMKDFKVVGQRADFIKDFKDAIRNNEDAIMIVATNAERATMNNIARTEKFGPNRSVLENGEKLISIANSTDLANSETFTGARIGEDFKKYSIQFTFEDKPVTFEMHLGFITDDNNIERKTMFFPDISRPSLYHGQILNAIKYNNRDLYDELKRDGYIKINKEGKPRLSDEIVIATYGYAITGHKSQGSQWEKIFVNQNYVAPSWNPARWYYTAITRSSKDVIVLPTGSNTLISPSAIETKINGIVTSEEKNVPLQTENFGKPKIAEFYSSLTDDQVARLKIDSLEDLIQMFDEIPINGYTEDDFINELNCKM